MTHTEALEKALEALHHIGSGIKARRLIRDKPDMTGPLRASLLEKSLTDEQVMELSLDTWEAIILEVEPKLPGTTIFECLPDEANP